MQLAKNVMLLASVLHDKEFTTEFDGKPIYIWMFELTDPAKVMLKMDLYWIVEGDKKYGGLF